MKVSDCILVSIECELGKEDRGVLIVGRKRSNESVEIINAFQGADAMELYKKLTTVKEKEN